MVTRNIIYVIVLFYHATVFAGDLYTPLDMPVFKLQTQRSHFIDGTVYGKVLSVVTKDFGNNSGRATNVHETIHTINNSLSNKKLGYRGFYVGNGYGIYIKEPSSVKMEDIKKYIPQDLRGYRYNLYFVSQLKYWNNIALYPIDEWVCYIHGAECSVQDYKNGITSKTNTDSVSGSLEFSIYALSLCLSIKNMDIEYWNNENNFKKAIGFYLMKAHKVFNEGRHIFKFKEQDKLLDMLRHSEQAKNMRNLLHTEFNDIFISR